MRNICGVVGISIPSDIPFIHLPRQVFWISCRNGDAHFKICFSDLRNLKGLLSLIRFDPLQHGDRRISIHRSGCDAHNIPHRMACDRRINIHRSGCDAHNILQRMACIRHIFFDLGCEQLCRIQIFFNSCCGLITRYLTWLDLRRPSCRFGFQA